MLYLSFIIKLVMIAGIFIKILLLINQVTLVVTKKIWILGFIIVAILLSFFFSISKVSGTSMEPNIKNGTMAIFFKNSFFGQNFNRGNIVLYQKPDGSDYIGRIVALPKESIRFDKGNFYINNNVQKYKVEEEYLAPDSKTYDNTEDGNSLDWISVGEYKYLILPDKRNGKFNIENQLINKSNIRGDVLTH